MRITLALLATASLAVSAVAGDNWPQFRGPHGECISDSKGLPLTWSEKENVVWKTPIHDKGWSSPVVWGEQVWLTTAKADGTELYAVCVERTSGKVLHDLKVFDVDKPEFCIATNSYASPTPAIEDGRVYVHFGTYGTACLDTKTGEKLWERRDLHVNHFRGPGSSPILYGDLLIVNFDGFDAQYVVALNKASGKTVWKKDRDLDYGTTDGDHKKAYGTPSVLTIKGKPQLVSPGAVGANAYDPQTGEELWKVQYGGMNVTAPPLYGQGRVFLCTGDGGLRLLAVRPEGGGDLTKTGIDWTCKKNLVPSRSSPVLVDDLLYMASNDGVVACLDAKTGDEVWQQRATGPFWASPLYADGRLYLFGEDGTTTVGEVGRGWKKLATNKLDDGCMATPAAAGKSLFIRTKTNLYRIEQKD